MVLERREKRNRGRIGEREREDIDSLETEVCFSRLMRPVEVAFVLNVGERYVQRLAEAGVIPAKKLPDGKWRFDPRELKEWISSLSGG